MVYFFLVLLLATTVPMMALFGFLCFFIRYQIQKYKIIHEKEKDYYLIGKLRKRIIPYYIFCIILSGLLNFAFLRVVSEEILFIYFGTAIVFAVFCAIVAYFIYRYCKKRK